MHLVERGSGRILAENAGGSTEKYSIGIKLHSNTNDHSTTHTLTSNTSSDIEILHHDETDKYHHPQSTSLPHPALAALVLLS